MMDPQDPAYPGQREYTPLFLRIYDPVVLGFFAPVECGGSRRLGSSMPTGSTSAAATSMWARGPATSWIEPGCPDDCRITLLDPNPHVLAHGVAEIGAGGTSRPSRPMCALRCPCRGRSTRRPSAVSCTAFPDRSRARRLPSRNVAAVLAESGVLFGASILGDAEHNTRLSRSVLRTNNRRGTFDNLADTEEGLREILDASFHHVDLETIGSMAVFSATRPRTGLTPSTE